MGEGGGCDTAGAGWRQGWGGGKEAQQPCSRPGEHLPSVGTHIFCPRSGCTRLGALTCARLQLSKAVNISEALQAWKRWRCFKRSPEPNQPIVGLINIPFVFLLCQKAAIKESERQTQAGLSLHNRSWALGSAWHTWGWAQAPQGLRAGVVILFYFIYYFPSECC